MAALARNLWKSKIISTRKHIRKTIDDRGYPEAVRDLARNYIEIQEKTTHSSLTWVEARRLLQDKQQLDKAVHNLFRDTIGFQLDWSLTRITRTPVLTTTMAILTPSLVRADMYPRPRRNKVLQKVGLTAQGVKNFCED